MGKLLKPRQKRTERGTRPVDNGQNATTWHKGRVSAAESIREGVESVNKVGQLGRAIGAIAQR